jgi:hypothetical protein
MMYAYLLVYMAGCALVYMATCLVGHTATHPKYQVKGK